MRAPGSQLGAEPTASLPGKAPGAGDLLGPDIPDAADSLTMRPVGMPPYTGLVSAYPEPPGRGGLATTALTPPLPLLLPAPAVAAPAESLGLEGQPHGSLFIAPS